MNATTAQPDILANPPFYYVMVVWGDKYVDMLLGVTLPCLMAPGNLPAMPNRQASRFLIMTTEKDRARISSSPVFAALDATVKVQFVPAPWIEDDASRYVKASRGHQEGARLAAENGAWCVFLVPDILVSDGAMPYLLRMANEGKQAVMVPGLRVVRETIDPAIDAKRAQCAAGVLEFGARELVALGLRHVHPFDRRFDWDSPQFSRQPVICTWRVPGEDGLLLRAFHLHPILMKMNGMGSVRLLDRNTIDDEFLGLNFPDWSTIHVETDSDNIVLFSLTDERERNAPAEANRASVEKLRALAYSNLSNPLHRFYFTRAIKLHAGALNERWAEAEARTGFLAYEVLKVSGAGMTEILQYVDGRTLLKALAAKVARRVARQPG